jgi:hypothetical protein
LKKHVPRPTLCLSSGGKCNGSSTAVHYLTIISRETKEAETFFRYLRTSS